MSVKLTLRLKTLLFLPFLPLIYLSGYLADAGCAKLFDQDEPEINLKTRCCCWCLSV